MQIPKDMGYGFTHKTRFNGDLIILEYINCNNVRAMFSDTGYEVICQTSNIRAGNVKDKSIPIIHGVGYLGGDYYKCDRKGIDLKCYDTWRNMLSRCYSELALSTHPTYIKSEVCEEWQNYQNFAEWFHENYPKDDAEYHIDKDIIKKGNKIYSPDYCSFVTANENIMEMNKRLRMRRVNLRSPNGDVFDVLNVSEFCRGNNISQSGMSRLINRKQASHKGWTLA